jgi:hypothetical protein
MFDRLFFDHPRTVDETYFEHMRFALTFAFWLTVAGLAALVHAFVPALCESTASRIVRRLHDRMTNRVTEAQQRLGSVTETA